MVKRKFPHRNEYITPKEKKVRSRRNVHRGEKLGRNWKEVFAQEVVPVLTDTNFHGPLSKMSRKPKNNFDKVAYRHDIDYATKYKEAPYYNANEADEKYLDRIEQPENQPVGIRQKITKQVGKAVFNAKKLFTSYVKSDVNPRSFSSSNKSSSVNGSKAKMQAVSVHTKKHKKKPPKKKLPKYRNLKQVAKVDKSIENRIKKLEKVQKVVWSDMIYLENGVGSLKCAANSYVLGDLVGTHGYGFDYLLDRLTYFSPAAPTVPVVADTTNSNPQLIAGMIGKAYLKIRNNHNIDAVLDVALCTPKAVYNAAGLPSTYFAGAVSSLGMGSSVSSLIPFYDIISNPEFKAYYKVEEYKQVKLKGGASINFNCTTGWMTKRTYDPEIQGTGFSNLTRDKLWLVRVQGCTGHDSDDTKAVTEIGDTIAYIDFQIEKRYRVKYNGGMKMKKYLLVDNRTAPTNGYVQEGFDDNPTATGVDL